MEIRPVRAACSRVGGGVSAQRYPGALGGMETVCIPVEVFLVYTVGTVSGIVHLGFVCFIIRMLYFN